MQCVADTLAARFLCRLLEMVPLGLCLLACHPKPAITKTMLVQVCSESVGHAETVPLTYNSQQAACGEPLLLTSCASSICCKQSVAHVVSA